MALNASEIQQVLPVIQGYKAREILATQSATAAPTEVILNNQFPSTTTFTWARTSAGLFTLTAGAATFTAGKTSVVIGGLGDGLYSIKYTVTSTTVLTFQSGLLAAGVAVATDGVLLATYFKIIVQN